MNPQSYRKKLETAIEQRDQLLLDELEQIANDSPATSRLWQDHCLLERAIDDWVSSSLLSEIQQQPATSASLTTTLPVISKKKKRSKRSLPAAISGIACLLFAGWFATGQHQLQEKNLPVAQVQVTSAKSILQTTSVVLEPIEQRKQKRKPFAPLNHSYDLVEQSKTFFPSSVLPPVIPDVTNQIAEEVSQTWGRLSVLPEEMQQVWKNLNLPTENESNEASPTEEMPTKPKAPRRFSFFNMLS